MLRKPIVNKIHVKRIHEPADPGDGMRILVDRLWPRGMTKAMAKIDLWRKHAAPSDDLRRWFGHSPERWAEFRGRYFDELDRDPQAWTPIVEALQQGDVTLLFAAGDTSRNNAVALLEYLTAKLRLNQAD